MMQRGQFWTAGGGRRGWDAGTNGPPAGESLYRFWNPYDVINWGGSAGREPEPEYWPASPFMNYYYHISQTDVGWGRLIYLVDNPPRLTAVNRLAFRFWCLQENSDTNAAWDSVSYLLSAGFFNNGDAWGDPAGAGAGVATATTTAWGTVFVSNEAISQVNGTQQPGSIVRIRLQSGSVIRPNAWRFLGMEGRYFQA